MLIIEDHPHIRELWADFARACGCEADVAADGNEGLGQFASRRYQLVVTDLAIPGMNGQVVARTARQTDPRVAVILITGSVSEPEFDLLREPGLTVLRKPVRLADFRAAVQSCLARLTDTAVSSAPDGAH